MGHKTQGKVYSCLLVYDNYIKDMDEQPDEEELEVRSGRVPSAETIISKPHNLGIFMAVLSHRHDHD